jgi:hypothetical protein
MFAREFFLTDRRAKFPKLPACETCNNVKSKLEHYLTAVPPFGGQYPDELVTSLKWSPGHLAPRQRSDTDSPQFTTPARSESSARDRS